MDGAALLGAWLKKTGNRQRDLAVATGLGEDQVSRFLRRLRRPDLNSAVAIDVATSGAVPAGAWVQHRKNGRRKAS